MQLEAYLQSLYHHLSQKNFQTYILYKVDRFDEQYSELFKEFPDCIVIREKDFHDDFINLFEQIDTKYILFGTDDVVYYDSVDFAVIDRTFDMFPKDIFGFSLRLRPQTLIEQADAVAEVDCAGERVYRINWQRAHSHNGRYPFELNSTFYRTPLVRQILSHVARERPLLKKIFAGESLRVKFLKQILSMKNFLASLETFNNPNNLEGYCYRWCKTHKSKMPDYLYFQKLCASAIQVNRVNTTVDNPTDGRSEHTIEALNEKYKQGYRLDIGAIEKNKPQVTHVGRQHFRLVIR